MEHQLTFYNEFSIFFEKKSKFYIFRRTNLLFIYYISNLIGRIYIMSIQDNFFFYRMSYTYDR